MKSFAGKSFTLILSLCLFIALFAGSALPVGAAVPPSPTLTYMVDGDPADLRTGNVLLAGETLRITTTAAGACYIVPVVPDVNYPNEESLKIAAIATTEMAVDDMTKDWTAPTNVSSGVYRVYFVESAGATLSEPVPLVLALDDSADDTAIINDGSVVIENGYYLQNGKACYYDGILTVSAIGNRFVPNTVTDNRSGDAVIVIQKYMYAGDDVAIKKVTGNLTIKLIGRSYLYTNGAGASAIRVGGNLTFAYGDSHYNGTLNADSESAGAISAANLFTEDGSSVTGFGAKEDFVIKNESFPTSASEPDEIKLNDLLLRDLEPLLVVDGGRIASRIASQSAHEMITAPALLYPENVSYKERPSTLTLSGATLTNDFNGSAIYQSQGELNIALAGKNSIDVAAASGISCADGEIHISGNGSLTISAQNQALWASDRIALASNVEITSPANAAITEATIAGKTVFSISAADELAKQVTFFARPPRPDSTEATAIIDGNEVVIGEVIKTSDAGTGTTTATLLIDPQLFSEQLQKATGDTHKAVFVLPNGDQDVDRVELTLRMIGEAQTAKTSLTMRTANEDITLPSQLLKNDDDLATAFGTAAMADAENVAIFVSAGKAPAADVIAFEEAAVNLHYGDILRTREYKLEVEYKGQTAKLTDYGAIMRVDLKRDDAVPVRATALKLNADGKTARPIPTFGSREAISLSLLGGSTYALIYDPVEFADVQGTWFADVANEMATRKILLGRSGGAFEGTDSITRAEFAALAVRALGLAMDGEGTKFKDVKATDWFCGAVGTAAEYGIVKGYVQGDFKPNANITRQEAMVMTARAAAVAEYAGSRGSLSGFADSAQVSVWARDGAAFATGSGIFKGNGGKLRPLDVISRAESATAVLRLLQKSGLVDVRTVI